MIAAFFGIFFFGLAYIVLGAILPDLQKQLSLSDPQCSTLASMLPLGTLFGSLVFGPIIDRFGYKLLLTGATALGIAGLGIIAGSSDFALVALGVILTGLCGGMLNGSTSALVSDISSDNSRTSNLFILGIVYCIGSFTIPLIMASAGNADFRTILFVACAVMALSMLYYIVIKFPEAKCKQGIPMGEIVKMIKEPILIIFAFTLFFQSSLEGLANTWTRTYYENSSIFAGNPAVILTFIPIGLAISRVLLAVISRFVKGSVIIAVSMLFAVAGAALLPFATSQTVAIIGALILGMGLAAGFPVVFGIVGEKFSKMSGTAFSFCLVIALLGNTLLNSLIGALGVNTLPVIMIASAGLLFVLFTIGNTLSHKTTKSK